jgi:fumarate reductase subunit C
VTGIDTELYPKAETRHSQQSSAFKKAKRALMDERISALTGAFLAFFILGHLVLESSILVSAELYETVANFMEHTVPMAQPLIFIVTIAFFLHFVWAGRKIPGKLRDRKKMLELGEKIKNSHKGWQQDPHSSIKLRSHFETSLWITQVRTAMIVLAAGAFHLFLIMWNIFTDMGVAGQTVGLTEEVATSRVESGLWILYAILMVSVVAHMAIGVYRLIVKWFADTWFVRNYAKALFYFLFWFYTILGAATVIAMAGPWEGILS